MHPVGTYSAVDLYREHGVVPTFLLLVLRSVRVALSTGFGEGEYRSGRCPPASYPVPFGQASQPFGLAFLTVAQHAFAC